MDSAEGDDTTAIADGGEPPETNEEGETLREELAGELGIEPGEMENWFRVGDPQSRREKLEQLVEVLDESETFAVPESFDEIRLIPKGYRYHRSETALRSY